MKKRIGFISILVFMLTFTLVIWFNFTHISQANGNPDNDLVTFSVDALGENIPKNPKFNIELHCDDKRIKRVKLSSNNKSAGHLVTVADRSCEIQVNGENNTVLGDEVIITVSSNEGVLARQVGYPKDGDTVTTDFITSDGELNVEVSHEFNNDLSGTDVKVMEWNIWGGGREAGGGKNVDNIIEVIRRVNPDILFTVETYQSGEKILAGLNDGLPEDKQYTGFKVTRQEVHQPENDNLWIFTRFPIVKEYPVMHHPGLMNDFHFGGAKVKLPNGQELNLFNTWIYHADWAWDLTNTTVGQLMYGLPRTYTNAEITATDLVRRIDMTRTILNKNLPTLLKNDQSPTIMAGDFNTLSHLDWSERFEDAPGHEGLILQWPVTQLIEEAGFTDTYRYANPDAARFPGSTWSPYYGNNLAPGRIDYIWTAGREFRILSSYTIDERIDEHASEEHPFYSDHAAVVTELKIRNAASLPESEESMEDSFIPQDEMSAVSSTEHIGYEASKAIDGNLNTMWHSEWSPLPPMPQSITIDLGDEYDVTGLAYQTRTDFKPDGIITDFNIFASNDGSNFTKVSSGTWERDYSLKTANFDPIEARYIKLEAVNGSGNVASAAEINIAQE